MERAMNTARPPVSDHRRHARFPVPHLVAAMNPRNEVQVTDISRTGLRMESAQPVDAGKLCFLEVDQDGQSVDLLVQVKWADTPGTPERCTAGAEFVDVFGEARDGLWRHLGASQTPVTDRCAKRTPRWLTKWRCRSRRSGRPRRR